MSEEEFTALLLAATDQTVAIPKALAAKAAIAKEFSRLRAENARLAEKIAESARLTDEQIVAGCNALARLFYKSHGYETPPGFRFDKSSHPQEQEMWNLACIAYEVLLHTDPNDAIANV